MSSPYIPNTDADRRAMMERIGVSSVDALFDDIPAQCRDPVLTLPPPLGEMELVREMSRMAARNQSVADTPCFLGAGAYRHFIPSVVDYVVRQGALATAYTPYQPEISQGTLQSIFEFQSLVCELTGMDVANAGMYDGASALAEACLMAVRISGRERLALLSTVNPRYRQVVQTYADEGHALPVDVMTPDDAALRDKHACLVVQQPDFFGCLEEVDALAKRAHDAGALYVVVAEPLSLGILKSPGEYGADIVVAEGQPLGIPLSFGGPYLGLFATRREHIRQMPGRLVGRTTDVEGRTGYVLTLQTREQHIRRERATSNICTNEQLCALAATVYLCAMGKKGLRRVAELCYHKAHYAAERIAALPGYSLPLADRPFFTEFVVRCPRQPREVNAALLERGIIGGLDVSEQVDGGMLLCVTEMNSREEIDGLVEALREIGG